MNIYFHIDELYRDSITANALRKRFNSNGHNLLFGNRLTNLMIPFCHNLFDIIIVPRPHFLYDFWGDDWINWKTKIVILSTENLGIICKDHRVMARTLLEKEYFEGITKYINSISLFCYWGKRQLSSIQKYAPEIYTKCKVVGHPRHDELCYNQKTKKSILKKNKIAIISRAVMLNDYMDRSPLESFKTMFDPHFIYEYFNKKTGSKLLSKRPQIAPGDNAAIQALDIQTILKIIKKLKNNDYSLSLRLHPKENIEVWRKLLSDCSLNIEISDRNIPFTHWIKNFDYVIGAPSTTFYESLMAGVTPISICQIDSRRSNLVGELFEENNKIMEFVYKPLTIDDLFNYIKVDNSILDNVNILKVLKEESNFPDCKTSLKSVVDECEKLNIKSQKNLTHAYAFYLLRSIFNFSYGLLFKLKGKKQNSATFFLNSKNRNIINNIIK